MSTITIILIVSILTAILTWVGKQIIIKFAETQLGKPYNPTHKYNHWLYYDILSIIQYASVLAIIGILILSR